MKSFVSFSVLAIVLICTVLLFQNAQACDSCGRECASACGTRHFRTCCFNYLRKRSGGQDSNDVLAEDRNAKASDSDMGFRWTALQRNNDNDFDYENRVKALYDRMARS